MSNYTKTDRVEFDVSTEGVKEVGVANCKNLNMRSMPDIRSSILTVLSEGTRLKVVKQPGPEDKWVQVSTEDKKAMVGYVLRQYVRVI